MKDFLVLLGAIAALFIIIGVLIILVNGIKTLIHYLAVRYRYKHRFDKSPTASCYCTDCIYHNNDTGECYRLKPYQYTADNWFCWNAEPKKHQ